MSIGILPPEWALVATANAMDEERGHGKMSIDILPPEWASVATANAMDEEREHGKITERIFSYEV